MLTIVGFLWHDPKMIRPYTAEDANKWARNIHRYLKMPHRFVLVTDYVCDESSKFKVQSSRPDSLNLERGTLNGNHFDPLIEVIPIWDDWRELRHPKWQEGRAHCYVRLKAFSAEIGEIFGDRFVCIDLDVCAMDWLDPLFDRPEDFVIYHRPVVNGVTRESNKYQGGMWMMTAGSRRQVWDDFKGIPSIEAAAQFMGTDQAWIRYKLGPNEAGWGVKDGVVKWLDIHGDNRYLYEPPEKTRLIFFQGDNRPDDFVKTLSQREPRDSHLWVDRYWGF